MTEFKIDINDWTKLKLKLKRKYNHLTDEDLVFKTGGEEALIHHLEKRLNRNREYILFTLKKGLINIDNNRL